MQGFGKKKVNLEAKYYLPNRRGYPDLINLLQATCNILEKAKIVENDRYIIGFDVSRIAGIDKVNPRNEIIVEEIKE